VPIQLAQCWFYGLAISNAKYHYIFQIKYTEAVLSNSTRKLLWFETTEMAIAVKKSKFIGLFIIISGTLSLPISLLISKRTFRTPGAGGTDEATTVVGGA